MRSKYAITGFLGLALASATSAEQAAPPRIDIILANFSFAPATLRLKSGQPVTLHFVNRGSSRHNYAAASFFGGAVPGGKVDLDKGESRDVTMTPKAGRYAVRCTHFLHTRLGMRGDIVVD